MTFALNNPKTDPYPSSVTMFEGIGSPLHIAFGWLAGSGLVTPQEAIVMLAAFAGYQMSQAQAGEPWTRTGGEFLEFALGMLIAIWMHG